MTFANSRLLLGVVLGVVLTAVALFVRSRIRTNTSRSSKKTEETSAKLDRGRKLYRRHCRTCHGAEGRGQGSAAQFLSKSPLNFHSDTTADFSNRQLKKKIREGKPSTGMPAWEGSLSRAQREAIVMFLRKEFIGEN